MCSDYLYLNMREISFLVEDTIMLRISEVTELTQINGTPPPSLRKMLK